ncbi:hypothetical protein RJT34_22693 [Clitoria ternatea]|uniref:BSD domain-containing protein n=1 Tax=Clitoria ternatea TaxID=43366 RepID=A0AAN9FRG2_CLITE
MACKETPCNEERKDRDIPQVVTLLRRISTPPAKNEMDEDADKTPINYTSNLCPLLSLLSMNFFKSVFSDDPDPPQPQSGSNNAPHDNHSDSDSSPTEPRSAADNSDGWNFGGLIKTLTSKSESIIETYRRDLQEFGTGLRKEIEVAQGSIGTVGHVIDEFGNTVVKGTAQIISQGKDAILAIDLDSDSDNGGGSVSSARSLDSKRYSRFEAQVLAIQGDVNTYSEEPEDLNEFHEWKSGFSLEEKSAEKESLLRENEAMESVYNRFVPNTVDGETFWYRYYYKVYKLKKAEDVRARLVKGISREDEDLSWDVEEDDNEDEEIEVQPELGVDTQLQINSNEVGTKGLSVEDEFKEEKREILLQKNEPGDKTDKGKSVEESSQVEKSEVVHEVGGGSKESNDEECVDKSQVDDGVKKNDPAAEFDEKVVMGREESCSKNNKSSVVQSQHSAKEEEGEELGWDDIGDLTGIDDKKATQGGSMSNVDLRKRLSVAEEEEDLSWDIEDDDDEPTKA